MPTPVPRNRASRPLVRSAIALLAFLALNHAAWAQAAEGPELKLAPEANSALDGPLFYQLLIGEIELRAGEPGEAYQIILDAARRNKDEQIFLRATEIALQGRAGDQALTAVKAWRLALPESTEALRYQVQLLVQLNRTPETYEPVQLLVKLTPVMQRPALISALPRLFARSTDRALSAALIEQVLQPYMDAPDTRIAARVTAGRGWLGALDGAKALAYAQRAHAQDPQSEAPAALALEMLPGTPAADAIVQGHLAAKPDSHAVRLLYVRSLLGTQRYADATMQLDTLTRAAPQMAQAWLTLGALHLQLREPAPATVALQKYVDLVQAGEPAAALTRPARRPMTTRRRRRKTPSRAAGCCCRKPPTCKAISRPQKPGSRRSTTRSAPSKCSLDALRCWRARARWRKRVNSYAAFPSASPAMHAPRSWPKRRCCARLSSGPMRTPCSRRQI